MTDQEKPQHKNETSELEAFLLQPSAHRHVTLFADLLCDLIVLGRDEHLVSENPSCARIIADYERRLADLESDQPEASK